MNTKMNIINKNINKQVKSKLNTQILVIPCVSGDISKERIAQVFKSLNICELEKIRLLPNKAIHSSVMCDDKYKTCNIVYIHVRSWFNNETALCMLDRLSNHKEMKIGFDDEPCFWKISAYREREKEQPTT